MDILYVIPLLGIALLGRYLKKYTAFICASLILFYLLNLNLEDSWDLFSLVFSIIIFCSLVYSYYNIKERYLEFYLLLYLIFIGIVFLLSSSDLIETILYFEMISLPSYALVGYKRNRKSLLACLRYCVVGIFGSILILLSLTFYLSGNTLMFLLFLLLGSFAKIPSFPLHFWLPDAHTYAPTEISSVLSSVVIGAAFLFLIKVLEITNLSSMAINFPLNIILPIISLFISSFSILLSFNPKRVLAYSSIFSMNTIVLAYFFGEKTAAMLYLLNHSIAKALAFLCVGFLVEAGGRDYRRIEYSKYLYAIPALHFALLSLIGFPPFFGFYVKLFLIKTLIMKLPFIVLILILSLLYIYKFFDIIWISIFKTEKVRNKKASKKLLSLLPLLLILVTFSIFPELPLKFLKC